jgi:hypothetical protein
MMHKTMADITANALAALQRAGVDGAVAQEAAESCAFLEACSYPGLRLLAEALGDGRRDLVLVRDGMGFDLEQVSCVFIGPAVAAAVAADGRAFLRNVRHGLYLVPHSLKINVAIGCPVDPAFALGGERTKNPYVEKLQLAQQNGVAVDQSVWQSLAR